MPTLCQPALPAMEPVPMCTSHSKTRVNATQHDYLRILLLLFCSASHLYKRYGNAKGARAIQSLHCVSQRHNMTSRRSHTVSQIVLTSKECQQCTRQRLWPVRRQQAITCPCLQECRSRAALHSDPAENAHRHHTHRKMSVFLKETMYKSPTCMPGTARKCEKV